jgi:hypothetical protein
MLAESTFPIKPDALVTKAKEFMMAATKGSYDADAMASSFEFVGPVVGPLSKDAFLTAIGSFDLKVRFVSLPSILWGRNEPQFCGLPVKHRWCLPRR